MMNGGKAEGDKAGVRAREEERRRRRRRRAAVRG